MSDKPANWRLRKALSAAVKRSDGPPTKRLSKRAMAKYLQLQMQLRGGASGEEMRNGTPFDDDIPF